MRNTELPYFNGMNNNRCNGNEDNQNLGASDEAINAWLDRIVARLEILIINPLLGAPATAAAPVRIPRRIQPPARRTVALWIARRILRAVRSDLNAATSSLI